jgi:hypothetical protein
MKTKNKMKDFETEFEEWWEVAKEYFIKELEKNLAQHRAHEIILRYKLEAYQKRFQILFVDVACTLPCVERCVYTCISSGKTLFHTNQGKQNLHWYLHLLEWATFNPGNIKIWTQKL